MKTIFALLLVGLCAFAYAEQQQVNQYGRPYEVAGTFFLIRQKTILLLLKQVYQPNSYEDQITIARSYNISDNLQQYTNQEVVQEFIRYQQQGLLPRGQVFSIFYKEQRQQAIALAQVLYYAKDYGTFYKTAVWARDYANEGMFVYALSVAILHRQDTQGIILPPIYEINPYHFVSSEVINQAAEYKMKYAGKNNQDVYYIQANYSGWYLNADREQYDLSYFTEDVGLNAYYYYYNLDYPIWMGGEQYGLNKDRRGELFYYVHQQLLARYYLERLSNGYGSIPIYTYDGPIKTGYQSSLRSSNGLPFASRPAWSYPIYNPQNQAFSVNGGDNQFRVQQIEDYERRIRDAIDSGIILTEDGQKINIYEKDGLDILGRVIEANRDSPNRRLYGHLIHIARKILGYSLQPVNGYQINPSVLEQHETSLRDPIFYQLYKRIIYYFYRYKANLPNYTRQQLNYNGIKIENIEVDKLVTYFDNYEYDITNAVYLNPEEFQKDNIQIRARQYRLNNKPYTYKINIQSDKVQDVVVRVFLGPKYDEQGREIPLNENRVNFVELDKFKYNVQAGMNTIVRNSQQSQTVRDRTSYRTLYQKVMAALNGQEEFQLDMSEAHNGYPSRLVLPRGQVGGQLYQLYVFIGPYQPAQQQVSYDNVISAGVGSGSRYIDNLPLGYPLDRQIDNEQDFYVPNSYVVEVTIYHKSEKDIKTSRY